MRRVGAAGWERVAKRAADRLQRMGLTQRQAGRLQLWLGIAQLKMGDLYRAERALALAASQGQPAALYHLGQVYRLLRRPWAEVAVLRWAAARYELLGQRRLAVRCHALAAWALLVEGRLVEALPALAAGASAAAGQPSRELLIARALFLSLVGKRAEAEQLCLALLDQPPLPDGLRADIAWLLGCIALEAGDLTAAQLHAAIAHDYGVMAWNPPQIERIHQLRRRLAAGGGESRRSSARV